ncbi:MAG: hypothetical protein AAGH64_02205, partial [Planctomycetota bacterium]
KNQIIKVVFTAIAVTMLGMSGCCDRCGKQLLQALKVAYLNFANNASQSCNRLTPETADQCIGDRQDAFDASSALAIAAKQACDTGDRELMDRLIEAALQRLLPNANDGMPMSASRPMLDSRGETVNALPLFACSESVTVITSASADGQWVPKTTAIVNGREVLPEAAGEAAVADRRRQEPAVATITEILLATEPAALKFAEYNLIENGSVRYDNGLFVEDFTVTGSLSLSSFKPADQGGVAALPGEAKITVASGDGAIYLALDKTYPGNSLRVNADGSGTFQAAFTVRATDDFDFLPNFYESIWLELPLMMDADDLAIDFAAIGALEGCSIAPYAGGQPATEPAPNGFPAACDLVDTDGDGIPDTRRIEAELKEDMEDLYRVICEED